MKYNNYYLYRWGKWRLEKGKLSFFSNFCKSVNHEAWIWIQFNINLRRSLLQIWCFNTEYYIHNNKGKEELQQLRRCVIILLTCRRWSCLRPGKQTDFLNPKYWQSLKGICVSKEIFSVNQCILESGVHHLKSQTDNVKVKGQTMIFQHL